MRVMIIIDNASNNNLKKKEEKKKKAYSDISQTKPRISELWTLNQSSLK